MTELLGVLALVVAAVVAFLARQSGIDAERTRASRVAKEAESRRKEQAALDAGEAMRTAARERDEAMKRPASTVVGDAMRRGR